jgi:hypothetical protein
VLTFLQRTVAMVGNGRDRSLPFRGRNFRDIVFFENPKKRARYGNRKICREKQNPDSQRGVII